MLSIIYGSRIATVNGRRFKSIVKIGSFMWLPFSTEVDAAAFCRGYRSGMSRIWRTTFVMPKIADTHYRRGFRFAWIAHHYGKKFVNDQFPEVFIVKKDGENEKCQ